MIARIINLLSQKKLTSENAEELKRLLDNKFSMTNLNNALKSIPHRSTEYNRIKNNLKSLIDSRHSQVASLALGHISKEKTVEHLYVALAALGKESDLFDTLNQASDAEIMLLMKRAEETKFETNPDDWYPAVFPMTVLVDYVLRERIPYQQISESVRNSFVAAATRIIDIIVEREAPQITIGSEASEAARIDSLIRLTNLFYHLASVSRETEKLSALNRAKDLASDAQKYSSDYVKTVSQFGEDNVRLVDAKNKAREVEDILQKITIAFEQLPSEETVKKNSFSSTSSVGRHWATTFKESSQSSSVPSAHRLNRPGSVK